MAQDTMDPTIGVPTKEVDKYWIQCVDESGKSAGKKLGDKIGKWLIFSPNDSIDAAWHSICLATRRGELGFASKVSTAKEKPGFDNKSKVICVYTYDWTDEEDVMRVRNALRNMGFTQKLPYKTDGDTYAGKYSHQGDKRISKYYV